MAFKLPKLENQENTHKYGAILVRLTQDPELMDAFNRAIRTSGVSANELARECLRYCLTETGFLEGKRREKEEKA